jgi:hypothetical protein
MTTPTYSYTSSEPFERDDIELVKMFLSQFRDDIGNSYTLKERPDVLERTAKAVEAIAVADCGRRLAIEHTLIQPYEGQKSDDLPFLTVFQQLRADPSFRVPNRFIDVLVPAFAIPKGIDWSTVAIKVRKWFLESSSSFPHDGEKRYSIPGCGFELSVVVHTFDLPDTDGVTVVGRTLPSSDPFEAVLQRALGQKVPKLVAASADQLILLFEDGGTAIGPAQIGMGLDKSVEGLPELKKLDVWSAHTTEWKSNGDVLFMHVWPSRTGPRFWIKDGRFVKAKSS